MLDSPPHLHPFAFTAGSKTPRIIIVGEAWGLEEAKYRQPFVGQSGRELFRMLGEALKCNLSILSEALNARKTDEWLRRRHYWLDASKILLTNVIPSHPPENNFTHFLYSNEEVKQAKKNGKPLRDYYGIYPKPELVAGITSLNYLISSLKPDLVIACGNWPLHVLSTHCEVKTEKKYKLPFGIGSWRGSQTYTRPLVEGSSPCLNLLPIIHPAAILREWGFRHITVHDLRSRAGRYLSGQLEWAASTTNSLFRPSFAEAEATLNNWHSRCEDGEETWLSVDLETFLKQFISCIGFADDKLELCIPFFYFNEAGTNVPYFTPEQELRLWQLISSLLQHPNCKIIGQNFAYDTQYLHRYYNINAIVSFDTMVAHHLLYPGTKKTLEMLASLYCHSYCYWKDESEEWLASDVAAEDLWRYNCKDTRFTYEISERLRRALATAGLTQIYQFRLEEWKLAREMTLKGCNYDDELRKQFQQELWPEVNRLETWLLTSVPEAIRYTDKGKPWFTSAQKTMYILYEVLGIKPVMHKKTRKPTSDDGAINELCEREDTEWLAPLLERLRDMRSSVVYTRNFLDVTVTPRLHSQFNISTPETFRWSSSSNGFDEGGNLQNLPKLED